MSNFWADKLGGGQPAAPSAPASPPTAWWAPPQSAPSQAPRLPVTADYQPTVAPPHVQHAGRCPGCGGTDYFEVDVRQGPRCYSCGETTGRRTRNTTQGMMAVQREGTTAKRARQIPGAGFRPDIIVGSI